MAIPLLCGRRGGEAVQRAASTDPETTNPPVESFRPAIVALLAVVMLLTPTSTRRVAAYGAQAPVAGAIEGIIVDENRDVVPLATIALMRGRKTLRITHADGEGRFRFDIAPGSYHLRIEHPDGPVSDRKVAVNAARGDAAPSVFVIAAPPLTRGTSAPKAPPVPPLPSQEAGRAPITVFYATDRARTGSNPPKYGPRRGTGRLSLGTAEVRVPVNHTVGLLERPSITTVWFEDPTRHFVIERVSESDPRGFYEGLRSAMRPPEGEQAFVFIHGFNVSFEDALYRTAQIAADLNFHGAPILYSWPSEGHLFSYQADVGNAEWTVDHLQRFLQDVAARSGAKTIHLIAHSRGNQALLEALSRMDARSAAVPHFNQLALDAPDIDADEFRRLARIIRPLIDRATLYASSNDLALWLSRALQQYQRAGDTRPVVVIADGVDTIDVSAVDSSMVGHYYYSDNRSVLSDLYYVFQGKRPGDRATLRETAGKEGRYWAFQR
jgi:esterase/lipase superfamily enzyme